MENKRNLRVIQYFFTGLSWVGILGLLGTVAAIIKPIKPVDNHIFYSAFMFILSGIPSLMTYLLYRQLACLFKYLRSKFEVCLELIALLRRLGWLLLASFITEVILYLTFFTTKDVYKSIYLQLDLTNTNKMSWLDLAWPSLGSGTGTLILFFCVMALCQFLTRYIDTKNKLNVLEEEQQLTI